MVMRFRFKPTSEQRAALRAQLARLQQPGGALEMLHPVLPNGFKPSDAVCTLQGAHSDRFVMRVQLRSEAGEERAYAVKVYSDDFGERVWAHAQVLAARGQWNHDGPCLPSAYIARERTLIFP